MDESFDESLLIVSIRTNVLVMTVPVDRLEYFVFPFIFVH